MFYFDKLLKDDVIQSIAHPELWLFPIFLREVEIRISVLIEGNAWKKSNYQEDFSHGKKSCFSSENKPKLEANSVFSPILKIVHREKENI